MRASIGAQAWRLVHNFGNVEIIRDGRVVGNISLGRQEAGPSLRFGMNKVCQGGLARAGAISGLAYFWTRMA